MKYITPEEAGIASGQIQNYIDYLEEMRLSTHDVILMRGDAVFYETYWKPFHPKFLHRMYSVSKSFVSLAIGFMEQDGLIALSDPISDYFEDELKGQTDENMRSQTIRDMLMMSTGKAYKDWFGARTGDRVRFYFQNDTKQTRPPGTIFEYDSTASFVLGALAERLTGKPLLDYLREKALDRIGFSKEAYCLTCPGGHSWSDSAILCTPMDLLKTARFVMNKGRWEGRQLLNEAYVVQATSKQIDNNLLDSRGTQSYGYGYQFWMLKGRSFFFNGMGCQFAVCVPEKDLIFVYNGDNQGIADAKEWIINGFYQMIADPMEDRPLPPDAEGCARLRDRSSRLELAAAVGERHSPMEKEINGAVYEMADNPMGISRICFTFDGDDGKLTYTNAQGEKELRFGMCRNRFGKFPQSGYSDRTGSVPSGDYLYDCAASAAWVEPHKLLLKVQIIDKYFGRLNMFFSFAKEKLGVYMNKSAEDFLDEYAGFAGGTQKRTAKE